MEHKRYQISSLCEILSIDSTYVYQLVDEQLVRPVEPEAPLFDDEDVARIRMILDFQERFDLGNDAMEIILHLLDQIHLLQNELKKTKTQQGNQ